MPSHDTTHGTDHAHVEICEPKLNQMVRLGAAVRVYFRTKDNAKSTPDELLAAEYTLREINDEIARDMDANPLIQAYRELRKNAN